MSWAKKAAGGTGVDRNAVVEETIDWSLDAEQKAFDAAKAAKAARVWSDQQKAIFGWFETSKIEKRIHQHLIVRARAGTGKTTTILEAINHAPEEHILLTAFNKRIADELNTRIENPSASAMTLHSIGFRLLKKHWGNTVKVEDGRRAKVTRADWLTGQVCEKSVPWTILNLVSKLHTKGREILPHAAKGADLHALAVQFECDPDGFWYQQGFGLDFVCEAAVAAMELAAQGPGPTGIDFADMIGVPVRQRMYAPEYNLVVVDEAQDMSAAQLELARGILSLDGRMAVVGDDRQAIYAFRGADVNSLDRLKTELGAGELGLVTTYRCAKKIVALAQTLVPDIQAAETNPDGIVRHITRENLLKDKNEAPTGCFILSRLNAPLVSIAMTFLREGRKANIAGRDIGQGLKALIRQLSRNGAVNSVPQLLASTKAWEDKMVTRALRGGWKAKADAVRDQAETITFLAMNAQSVHAIIDRIDFLFTDDGLGAEGIITCSSIHKAKGLEANTVYILNWTLKDKGDNVASEESNLRYVAVTRAKNELVFVSEV